jgi:hypothetical protein
VLACGLGARGQLFVFDAVARGLAHDAAPQLDLLGPAGIVGEGLEGIVDAGLLAGLLGDAAGEIALVEAMALERAEAVGIDPAVDGGTSLGKIGRRATACRERRRERYEQAGAEDRGGRHDGVMGSGSLGSVKWFERGSWVRVCARLQREAPVPRSTDQREIDAYREAPRDEAIPATSSVA